MMKRNDYFVILFAIMLMVAIVVHGFKSGMYEEGDHSYLSLSFYMIALMSVLVGSVLGYHLGSSEDDGMEQDEDDVVL